MANAKEIKVPHPITGITVQVRVKREADGYLLNDADGTFSAAPADSLVDLTEHGTLKGLYEKSESRTAWDDGKYTVTAYASTDLNTIIASGQIEILDDLEIVNSEAEAQGTVDGVWNALLKGSTYNLPTSAGRRLRQLASNIYTDGTAQGGGPNAVTLAAGESATDDIFWQAYVAIVGGTGAGQGHHILTYNGTTKVAVIDDCWIIQPDATSEYIIYGSGSHDAYQEGLAQGGGNDTITLQSTADAGDDRFKDDFVVIVSGTGEHQARRVIAYNGTTKVATVSPDWIVNPDATSGYWFLPQGAIVKGVWDEVLNKADYNIGQSAGKRLRQLATLISADASINDVSPTDTSFITTLTSTVDNLYVDQVVVIVDDTDLIGQSRVCSAYDGTTKKITVDEAFSQVPLNGSDIIIFSPHVHPVSQISGAVWDQLLSANLIAGSFGEAMNFLLGLCLFNHVEDDVARTGDNKTSSTLYIYDSAANTTLHDKATGLIGSVDITASYSAGLMTLLKGIKG